MTIPEIIQFTTKDNWGWRLTAMKILSEYFKNTKIDYHDHV